MDNPSNLLGERRPLSKLVFLREVGHCVDLIDVVTDEVKARTKDVPAKAVLDLAVELFSFAAVEGLDQDLEIREACDRLFDSAEQLELALIWRRERQVVVSSDGWAIK